MATRFHGRKMNRFVAGCGMRDAGCGMRRPSEPRRAKTQRDARCVARRSHEGQSRGGMRDFRWVFVAVVLFGVLLLGGQAQADTARGRMKKGLKLMAEDQFLPAATNFVAASELAAGQEHDPAPAHFNAGNAFYRAEKLEEARASYTAALDTDKLELQSKAYYNLGNMDMDKADSALKEGKPRESVEFYDQAISHYEKAITLAPDYMAPKVNYEIGRRDKHELLAKVDQLKSDIKKAKTMIEDHEYVNAVRFMQSNMQEHELAFQLEEGLKKSYQELLKRTSDIAKIVVEAEKGDEGKKLEI